MPLKNKVVAHRMTNANSVSLVICSVVASTLISVAGSWFLIERHFQNSNRTLGASKVVFVDSRHLMKALQATLEKTLDPQLTPVEIKNQAAGKTTELMSVIQHWSDQGFIVVDRKSVLSFPSGADITSDVIHRMNLEDIQWSDPVRAAAKAP